MWLSLLTRSCTEAKCFGGGKYAACGVAFFPGGLCCNLGEYLYDIQNSAIPTSICGHTMDVHRMLRMSVASTIFFGYHMDSLCLLGERLCQMYLCLYAGKQCLASSEWHEASRKSNINTYHCINPIDHPSFGFPVCISVLFYELSMSKLWIVIKEQTWKIQAFFTSIYEWNNLSIQKLMNRQKKAVGK